MLRRELVCLIKTVIMGTGRMGSLIRTTAEGIVDAAGQPFSTSSPKSVLT